MGYIFYDNAVIFPRFNNDSINLDLPDIKKVFITHIICCVFFCGIALIVFWEGATTNLEDISEKVADKKGLSFIKDSLERSVFMKEYD